ncbi:hypothetical protein GWK47_021956 [Chionoecetes opilio]|uniref:Uncharacterized protein n=1 Tax=Chionoecetes opilio TaxID=41210 RepID=A0A8J4XR48_CHIOP|nr:hypothetical protein GWK47_021956 [Chionoecetes opilio]
MKKLETLVGKYEVRKKAKKRQSEGDKVSDALLQGHLASLFDIAAPATSSSMIHLKQKDKDFLDDQRGQRKMVMSTVDKESMAKESRKHERLAAERRRKEKELAETLERGEMIELVTGSSATAECADSSTSSSDTNSSARGSAAASASRPKRLNITKEVAAAADRVKFTSRGAHHVFSAIAADQEVLSPSTSSIRRHRKVLRKETAEAAVKDYRNQVQEHDAVLILHWDGKLLPGSESQGHVDRLAIVVTSPSLEGEKLLAIPALPSSTGEAMASKVEETIRHWKFEDRVGGLCFDTTALNTGVHAGCCTLLEQKLGRPLLNLACRHHVMELILASAFKATFGDATSGPDVQLFKRFQKKWPTLIKANATIINDPRLADHDEWKRTTLEALAKAAATTRDDYKELSELTAKAIKGEVPTTFRKPGAHHYARWMAKAIYMLKMTMFKNEFELTPRELRSLQEMSVFIILIYARAWFEAPLAADAPFNDLTLFYDLHKYRDLNSKISEATVKTFKRHFWYLGTDLVGLALFSDKVTIEEKTKMVEKLAIDKDLDKKRWTTAPQDPSSVTLSDLVTKESLFSFTELKLNASFLQSPVLSWKENEAYNQGKETVQQ